MSSRAQPSGRRSERRSDALSKERIVAAAVEILDREGEAALTFRALAAHLATGSGAIYWHVANKHELLVAATDDVVSRAVAGAGAGGEADPRQAILRVALALFDAIEAHPWAGAQLSREPWETAMLPVFDSFGRGLEALGVPAEAQFNAATTLLSYVLGLAGQRAAGARLGEQGHGGRTAFLAEVAARWTAGDAARYPFVQKIAPQLAAHDDREQFLAGVDLFLAGAERRT